MVPQRGGQQACLRHELQRVGVGCRWATAPGKLVANLIYDCFFIAERISGDPAKLRTRWVARLHARKGIEEPHAGNCRLTKRFFRVFGADFGRGRGENCPTSPPRTQPTGSIQENDPLIEHWAAISALGLRWVMIRMEGLQPAGTTCSVSTLVK
jgi:hypothetical protein